MKRTLTILLSLLMIYSVIPLKAQTDYSIKSVLKTFLNYRKSIDQITDYAREIKKKELLDSLIGSTISIPNLLVDPKKIEVINNSSTFQISINDAQLYKETFLSNPDPDEAAFVERGYVHILFKENSDRLAMEIVGSQYISVIGRIKEVNLDSYSEFVCEIEIISWSKK